MAQYELLLPKMGESVAEATIIKWVKQPGDMIQLDDTLLEIATDKVDSEVPSPVEGKLVKLLFKEDDVVQVGAVIALIETGRCNDAKPVVENSTAAAVETAPVPSPNLNLLLKKQAMKKFTKLFHIPHSSMLVPKTCATATICNSRVVFILHWLKVSLPRKTSASVN